MRVSGSHLQLQMLQTASSACGRPRWSSAHLSCWAELDQLMSKNERVWSQRRQSVCPSLDETRPQRSSGCDRCDWPLWHLRDKEEGSKRMTSWAHTVCRHLLGTACTFLPLPDGDGVFGVQADWQQEFPCGTEADGANTSRVETAQHWQRLLGHSVPNMNGGRCGWAREKRNVISCFSSCSLSLTPT